MTRWRWALLVFELFLFALILILPQVDLPDFTFHGGTAPVLAKARFSPPPIFAYANHSPSIQAPQVIREQPRLLHTFELISRSALSLFCVLLC
jgi:hypothetical protein